MIGTSTLVLIALGLAMDALAVAIATSIVLRAVSARQVFRFGFHFGLFQFFMPLLGWLAGRSVASFMARWDHWIAFALLTFVGVKAIRDAVRQDQERCRRGDPTRGLSLVFLSLATSIDAFAVGVSFAMLGVQIWYASVVIGVITGSVTTAGMILGGRLGRHFGQRVEILGGVVLVGIGVKIVMQHLIAA